MDFVAPATLADQPLDKVVVLLSTFGLGRQIFAADASAREYVHQVEAQIAKLGWFEKVGTLEIVPLFNRFHWKFFLSYLRVVPFLDLVEL